MARPDATRTVTSRRVALAFLAAPAAPTLVAMGVLAPLGFSLGGARVAFDLVALAFIYGVLFGYGPTLVFGAPLYLALRERLRVSAMSAAIAGLIVASLPWGFWVLLSPPTPAERQVVIWWIVIAAGLGALGGLTFWRVHEGGRRVRPRGSGA